MARTLPWLKGKNKLNPSSPRAQSTPLAQPKAKRARTCSLSSTSSDESIDVPTATLPDALPRHIVPEDAARYRSPSTSPPPPLPPTDLMRPGLEADDIYVMVEDEFYSIAQSYTQHLHHAEYKRLKELAKTRRADEIAKISRPTKGEAMSKERKMKKAQDERNERAQEAVDGLGAPERGKKRARNAANEGDDEDEDEDADIDIDIGIVEDDDPWVGTTLQPLMTHQNVSKSLVGLQGVKANTRAAAGLGRQRRQPEISSMYDDHENGASGESETASDSDDLDRPTLGTQQLQHQTRPARQEQAPRKVAIREPSPSSTISQGSGSRRPFVNPGLDRVPKTILKSKPLAIEESAFQDDFTIMRPKTAPRARARKDAGASKERVAQKSEGDVSEIPVFLV